MNPNLKTIEALVGLRSSAAMQTVCDEWLRPWVEEEAKRIRQAEGPALYRASGRESALVLFLENLDKARDLLERANKGPTGTP